MTTQRPSADLFGGPPSGPQLPPMPRSVENAGPSIAMAWTMQQAGVEAISGEINDEAFRTVVATRADARELVDAARYEVMGGPENGYKGGTLLDALPDTSEAVTAAIVVVRCQKYEAQLQAQAPDLQRAIHAAQQHAGDVAQQAIAQDWERYQHQVTEAVNNTRTGGQISEALRPPRVEPDLTDVRRAQSLLSRLGAEIHAVQGRQARAGRIVGDTLQRLAEAGARLLWIGPQDGHIPEQHDWTEMYQAYDVLLELCGLERADAMMDAAVKRWREQR